MKDYYGNLSDNQATSGVGRNGLIQLLNRQLADTVDLRSQARQAHFNVRGPYAEQLRSLFDGLALDLRRFADLIAQRITASGGTASVTVRAVANESHLLDYPLDALDAHDHLQAMLSGYSRYELDTGRNLQAAYEIGDLETVALLQVIAVSIEKDLWFLEAYLEGIAVGLHGRKLPSWTSAFDDRVKADRSESTRSSGAA